MSDKQTYKNNIFTGVQLSLNFYLNSLNFVLLTKHLYGFQHKDVKQMFLKQWKESCYKNVAGKVEAEARQLEDLVALNGMLPNMYPTKDEVLQWVDEAFQECEKIVDSIIEENIPISLDPDGLQKEPSAEDFQGK